MRITSIAFCILQIFAPRAQAQAEPESPVTIVLQEHQVEKINRKTAYFVDEKNVVTPDQAIAGKHDWKLLESENVTFGLESRTVWLKLQLKNPEEQTGSVHIELNPVFLEKIAIFDSSGKVLDQAGSKVAPARLDAFPTLVFQVPPGVHEYYVSVQSRGNAIAMILRSPVEHERKAKFDLAMACTVIGGLIALMIYHLFLFATYRNRNYFFYSGFIASTVLFTLSFTSYHHHALPAQIFGFETDFWWSAIAAEVLFLFMYLFSADLLNLFPGKNSRRKRLAFALLMFPIGEIASLVAIVATDHPYVLVPIRLAAPFHMLVFPAVAAYLWYRERTNKIAIYYAISWIPFSAGAFMIVSWLAGAVEHNDIFPWSIPLGVLVQSLLLSFAAGQRLNVVTRDKIKEQQDKLRVMDKLQTYVQDLETRDRVITAFVSSDIVSELDRGADPLSYEPQSVEKCIVFLDMLDYTTFSEAHSTIECYQVLNEYFKVINDTTYSGGGRVDKIIGDAMMIVFDDPAKCLESIVQLRRNLSEINRKRFTSNQLPIKFGMGISYGKMLAANFGSSQKVDRTIVGDTVNIASRLENITRSFAVDVLCSKEFFDLHPGYKFFRPAGYVLLKGRKKKSLVYEIFEHNLPDVVEWKIASRTAIHEIVEMELRGEYFEAISRLKDMIGRCPKHSYKEGLIMDPTLQAMVSAIDEKVRQLGIAMPSGSPDLDLVSKLRRA